jgi:hypothetical protein
MTIFADRLDLVGIFSLLATVPACQYIYKELMRSRTYGVPLILSTFNCVSSKLI